MFHLLGTIFCGGETTGIKISDKICKSVKRILNMTSFLFKMEVDISTASDPATVQGKNSR